MENLFQCRDLTQPMFYDHRFIALLLGEHKITNARKLFTILGLMMFVYFCMPSFWYENPLLDPFTVGSCSVPAFIHHYFRASGVFNAGDVLLNNFTKLSSNSSYSILDRNISRCFPGNCGEAADTYFDANNLITNNPERNRREELFACRLWRFLTVRLLRCKVNRLLTWIEVCGGYHWEIESKRQWHVKIDKTEQGLGRFCF